LKTKLIVNTANDELILSLYYKGKVFYKVNSAKMHHNETMLPLIDELLKENSLKIIDVEEFGVVIGPGSFTGVRVGIATIKAFRDALNAKAKSINNLDLLYKLASKQNPQIDTVAILGSFNSYFVAKLINGVVYKYPRNLTLDELIEISECKPIGVYKADENLNCFVVEFDADVLLNCYEESQDETLVPVYYQLSQAESEKLKRGEIKVESAVIEDCEEIANLENQSILNNPLSREDIQTALTGELYKTFMQSNILLTNRQKIIKLLKKIKKVCYN
jgi:tRNA threonylcarbamoyl adenosine modification protein YeaZ